MTARQCCRWAGPLAFSPATQRVGGIGSMDAQGGSADKRGTASWDGLTEPLHDSALDWPLMLVGERDMVGTAAGAAVIVGGLGWWGTGLCLARGDLFSLRAVIGDPEAWCRLFPGRMVGVICKKVTIT